MKSQISIFMILGVFVLFLVMLTLFLLPSRGISLSFDTQSITSYVETCLEKTTQDALILLGKQGGRIQLKEHVPALGYGISYALKDNQMTLASIPDMERELGLYIDQNIGRCLNNFDDFKRLRWATKAQEPSSRVSINREDISVMMSFPIVVTQREQHLSFSEFSISLPSSLSFLHAAASEIALFALEHQGKLDLTSLNAYESNITIFPYKGSLIVQLDGNPNFMVALP